MHSHSISARYRPDATAVTCGSIDFPSPSARVTFRHWNDSVPNRGSITSRDTPSTGMVPGSRLGTCGAASITGLASPGSITTAR